MRCIIVFCVLYFTMPISVWAQHSLSGTIRDQKTNEPLAGVLVRIPDLKIGALSDNQGRYFLKNIPAGKIVVEFRLWMYAGKAIEVNVHDSSHIDMWLEESITELHEVVVTGVSKATDQHENPVPIAIVSKSKLLEQGRGNLIEAISRQPGISQISTGQAISKPVIRGLGYNRVVTLYNGIRQEGQQWGDEHGIEIDGFSASRVELIKGPGTLQYGSDALAGVVHILTDEPLPEGKIATEITGQYQSNNHALASSVLNAGTINGINWQLRTTAQLAGNYQNAKDGYVFNSGYREWHMNGSLGINRAWGFARILFSTFNQMLGMSEGERDSASGHFTRAINDSESILVPNAVLNSFSLFTPYQLVQHHRIGFQFRKNIHTHTLIGNLAWQLSERKEFGNPQNQSQYGLFFYMPTYTYELKWLMPNNRLWTIQSGLAGMYQNNSNRGTEYLIPDYALWDIGLYSMFDRKWKKWHMSGGIRFDYRWMHADALYLNSDGQPATSGILHFSASNNQFQNISGSIGFTRPIARRGFFKWNLARGFRAPNPSELFSNGAHEGTYRYEFGAHLVPETSLQSDIGYEYHAPHISIEISVFANQMQHYIYARRLLTTNRNDSFVQAIPAYQYAQSDALLMGWEAGLDWHPHPFDWFHLTESFSYVRGKRLHESSFVDLPGIPPARLLTELRAHLPEITKRMQHSFIRFDIDYYAAQNFYLKENNTETYTPSYVLCHAAVGTEWFRKNHEKAMSLLFSVFNVGDISYQSHLSRFKYLPMNYAGNYQGIYAMGRNFAVKCIVHF